MHKIVNTVKAITGGVVVGLVIVIALVIVLVGLFEAAIKRFSGLMALILAALVFSPSTFAQGVVTGQETTIQYSGSNATIVQPNTPATSLNTPNGTNVFIIPIPNPSVSIRFYITNQTANACSNALTAQLWAVSDPQTFSFNNALTNWQVIPLQDSTGNLTQTLVPSLPASGVAYFSSTAISSPRVALQLVNVTGGCATTNLEVFAVIVQATVTTPLISTNSPTGFNGQVSNQVQGVIAQEQNGTPVNPIIQGGLQLPLNSAFLTAGIDNFSSNFISLNAGTAGLLTINASPAPAHVNELAVSIDAGPNDSGTQSIVSPWVCAPGNNSCTSSAGALAASSMKNPKLGTAFQKTFQNAGPGQDLNVIILYSSPTASIRNANIISNVSNTATLLAGSSIIAAAVCFTTNCNLTTPTDSQGNVYQLIAERNLSTGLRSSSLWVWASTTLSQVGSNTITFSGGDTTDQIEVSGVAPATITSLAVSLEADPTGRQVLALDAQFPNQFVCNVTLSTATTTQCQPAPTTIGAGGLSVPVRLYVTDVQYNTTTAGAGSTLQLKTGTGANCVTGTSNLSSILYSGAAVALQNTIGFRTPFVAPLQSALCVAQVGATPSTTTVEIHGYLAP